jgi:hypothetical protein
MTFRSSPTSSSHLIACLSTTRYELAALPHSDTAFGVAFVMHHRHSAKDKSSSSGEESWVLNSDQSSLPSSNLFPQHDDMHLDPHPELARVSARDTATLLHAYIPVTPSLAASQTPMQRWLAESSKEEPWHPYKFPPASPVTPSPTRGRSGMRSHGACGSSVARSGMLDLFRVFKSLTLWTG